MKQLLWAIMMIASPLFSFSFDFSLPPAQEEVVEPSVLGEEVAPKKEVKKRATRENSQKQETSTIYVRHEDDSDFSSDAEYASYPKIALLAPRKVIGRYANAIADSIFSYLLYNDGKFQFELFDSGDESRENILKTLAQIKHKGYQLVIAAVTQNGAKVIANHEHTLQVYIPTINKKEINLMSENIMCGGIDYEEQIDKLLTYAGDKVAIFNDKSALAKKLENYVDNASFGEISYRKTIKNAKINLSPYIKNNKKLKDASIFLNMPIVKTSLLASQLGVNDAEHKNVLLTQISYNPLLFTLTQAKDRAKMYLANSIGETDFRLKDINLILGTNIDFAWVNYSTLFGVDYLINRFIEPRDHKIFSEQMVNNQVRYHIEISKPTKLRFESIKN